MLKKIPPLMLAVLTALTLALAPAQDAAAWSKVCVKLPLWKAWFSATFHVAYDFNTGRGIPSTYLDDSVSNNRKWRSLPNALKGNKSSGARGLINSGQFAVNSSRCVDIREIPNGQPFIVYVRPAVGQSSPHGPAVVCETHRSNPNPWYFQQNRPYQELWYDSWGATWAPRCKFTHER